MFKESITKEELVDLPLKWFEGEIIVVETKDTLRKAIQVLEKQAVIGFDTETKPAFKKGVFNKVALLQLSTDKQAFLIRVNKIGLSKKLCYILANPEIIKTGVAIRDDIKGLQDLRKFQPGGFVELQDSAKDLGIQNFSLKKLTAITCGFRISKGAQLSNWEADEFTEKQKIYAATDAWTGLKIYKSFAKNI
jgi:ribonuclease D